MTASITSLMTSIPWPSDSNETQLSTELKQFQPPRPATMSLTDLPSPPRTLRAPGPSL